jgi:hypothetical protein
MKKLYFLNETEKERILNLYESKGNNKNILNEQKKIKGEWMFTVNHFSDKFGCVENFNLVGKSTSPIAQDPATGNLYYPNGNYTTKELVQKFNDSEDPNYKIEMAGTYSCIAKPQYDGSTKYILKRTEKIDSEKGGLLAQSVQGAKKITDANWPKEYNCVPGAVKKSDQHSGKFYKQTYDDTDVNNTLYYNTGVAKYYDNTGKVEYPKEGVDSPDVKKTFYPYSCQGSEIKLDTNKIVDIDNRPIGGTSVTTNPTTGQSNYTNKLANVGQKLGVQTSGQLTQDMMNKLMDKLGGTSSTSTGPTKPIEV